MATPPAVFVSSERVSSPVVREASQSWGPAKRLAILASLGALYFATARFGLSLAVVHASATAVWAPTGIALAAVLTLGYGVWPSIFIGALLANVLTAGNIATSLGIALGNTLEAVVGAFLLVRFANGRDAVRGARGILKLAVLAGMLSTAISASIGVMTLSLAGFASWKSFQNIWFTWWVGDAVGDLVVAPALLLWSASWRVRWTSAQVVEALGLLLSLAVVGMIVFGGLLTGLVANYPLEFLCTPFLLWAAYRFGQREAATATVLLAWIALWGTLHGFGPFGGRSPNESLLLMGTYLGVSAVMSLVLGAVVSEREQAVEQLRRLAVTDALTGLSNYRQLMDVLESEIRRSSRTGRPFAVLLLDLDRLKRINDRHGHVIGSRALCRVADALRMSSRAVDTAARYGGDEFAIVLPESDEEAARHVASRVTAELESDGEAPPVSVSVGIAVYPQDGQSCEALLASADLRLYDMKAAIRADSPIPA